MIPRFHLAVDVVTDSITQKEYVLATGGLFKSSTEVFLDNAWSTGEKIMLLDTMNQLVISSFTIST